MNGRYYWLKLKKDFFKRHDIRIIEGMPDGKDIVLFYIKLMLESVDHDGELRFSDEIPYTPEMLSSVTGTNIEIVSKAMIVLESLNLLIIDENSTIILPKVSNMVGCETEWAKKKREYRESQRQNDDNTRTSEGQSKDNVLPLSDKSKSKSKSKSIELDIKEKIIKEKSQSRFIPPTLEEVANYCVERNNNVDALTFVSFYEAKGWYIGKNKMKDWKAAVRTWENHDKNKAISRVENSGNPFDELLRKEGYL